MLEKLKVGQKLWIAPHDGRAREPHEATVTKVGCLYAHLDDGCRVNLSDHKLFGDGK